MAGSASRVRFTGEEVVQLFDLDGEDGGLEDTFFPGSDEELWMSEDESDNEEESLRCLACTHSKPTNSLAF